MKFTSSIAIASAIALAMTIAAGAQEAQQTTTTTTASPTQTTTKETTTTTTTTTTDPDADLDDTAAMGPDNKYGDPVCGTWANGVWQANGHCPRYAVGPHRARVAGTITAVKGHLVTVQQATKSIVIDDTPALNREMTGKVAVGRQIVAYGYYVDDNFYATAIH